MKTQSVFFIILFIVSLLILNTAEAEQSLTFEYGIYTYHVDEDPNKYYNNDNELKAIEYTFSDYYVNVASFINTYGNDSVSIGVGYNVWEGYNIKFDILSGLIYGYKEGELDSLCYEKTCAFVAPRFTYSFEVTPHWLIKPSVKLLGTAVNVAVGVEYKF